MELWPCWHTFQIIDDDGCQYVTALEFPNFKPPKKGHGVVIHGIENQTIYASIDYNAKADPLPADPVANDDDEEDVMGTLPSRRDSLNDDNAADF